MKKIVTLIGSLGLLLCSTLANAGHISCAPYEASAVTGALDCGVGHTNNDFLNPLQVNIDEMFGYNDWVFGIKSDRNSYESGAIGFTSDYFVGVVSSVNSSGWVRSWMTFNDTLENLFPGIDKVMLVLKGGNGGTTNSNYIGYDLDLTKDFIQFDTPFFNPNNFNAKGISHWSLYGRGGDIFTTTSNPPPTTDVPEPASLALFGLAGMGLLLTRRKTTNAKGI